MCEAPRSLDQLIGLLFTQETLQRLPEALGIDPEHPAVIGEIGAQPIEAGDDRTHPPRRPRTAAIVPSW